jgi:hypothetical protein
MTVRIFFTSLFFVSLLGGCALTPVRSEVEGPLEKAQGFAWQHNAADAQQQILVAAAVPNLNDAESRRIAEVRSEVASHVGFNTADVGETSGGPP